MKLRALFVIGCMIVGSLCRAQTAEQKAASVLGSQMGALYLQNAQLSAQVESLQRRLEEKEKACAQPDQSGGKK